MREFRKFIRIVWPLTGILFFLWLFYSSQSRGFPDSVLQSDSLISVSQSSDVITFIPIQDRQPVGFIFYPGSMVDPKAYAPLARDLAENGFSVFIVKLPLRNAFSAGQVATVFDNTSEIMKMNQDIHHWALAGHSRGGALASRFAFSHPHSISELILIGTSHPKDDTTDLSTSGLSVTKIYGTNDGIASVSKINETRQFLPPDTSWIEIEGGNHAQFGYYGHQLGDEQAEISREVQQELTVSAILTILENLVLQEEANSLASSW